MEGTLQMWLEVIVAPAQYAEACEVLQVAAAPGRHAVIQWQIQSAICHVHTTMSLLSDWSEGQASLQKAGIIPKRVSLWCEYIQEGGDSQLVWEPMLLLELEERDVHLCVNMKHPDWQHMAAPNTGALEIKEILLGRGDEAVPDQTRTKATIVLSDQSYWEVQIITPAHLTRYQQAFELHQYQAMCLPIHHTLLLSSLDVALIGQTLRSLLANGQFDQVCLRISPDADEGSTPLVVEVSVVAHLKRAMDDTGLLTRHRLREVKQTFTPPHMDFLVETLQWANEWMAPRKIAIDGQEKWQLICHHRYHHQWQIEMSPEILRQIWPQRFQLVLSGAPIYSPIPKQSL